MKTIYHQPIERVIEARHSVRNYTEEPLSEQLMTQIENYIEQVVQAVDKKIAIKLIKKSAQTEGIKLGTYGVIKGANYYLITSCEDKEQSLITLGYALEKVILYCTSLGLGTVWLGGTFNKSAFAKAIGRKEGQILPIVSPVGYEGGKKSMLGNFFSKSSNRRKEFTEICYESIWNQPLTMENAGEFAQPLDMLRLAPSAVNKQPWRMIKEGDTIHFYLTATKALNYVDLGIALCHFDLTAQEKGLHGVFVKEDKVSVKSSSDCTYVVSFHKTN